MRVAPKVTLTDEQRVTLRRWSRGRTTPMRLVRRAQIVLLAAEDQQNIEIGEQLGIERTIVGRWRRRFVARGLAGLEKDAPRGGRPANTALARKIVEHTTRCKPSNATHWSTNSLAVCRAFLARFFRRSVVRFRHGYQICERRSDHAHAAATGPTCVGSG